MALFHEIRALANQCLVALDAGHDYYFHTDMAWRLVRRVVAKGVKFNLHNKATNSTTNQQQLIGLIQDYLSNLLTPSTFQHFVSIFEDFVFDLLRLWLSAFPASLSDKEIKFGLVLKAPDKVAVTQTVIDRELNELKYEKVADWFEYLEKRMKLGCPSRDVIELLAEMKAARDIVVHNKGIVNAVYLMKAGKKARYQVGDRLMIPEQYHRECWQTIKQVIAQVAEAAANKALP